MRNILGVLFAMPGALEAFEEGLEMEVDISIPVTINDWTEAVHATAVSKGFHDRPLCETKARDTFTGEPEGVDVDAVLAKLALIHSEVSEALEAARLGKYECFTGENGKQEGVVTELADTVIRIMDTCGALGLDLQGAMAAKLVYNESRSKMHGGKLA